MESKEEIRKEFVEALYTKFNKAWDPYQDTGSVVLTDFIVEFIMSKINKPEPPPGT